jgi:PII-like signaling protein
MVGPDERCGDLSASDAIVQAAHHLHLAQPVVTGSMRGYRRLFARLLGIDQSAPVIVEIIDARAKLEGLARQVHELLPHAAINWSTVEMWVPLEVIEPDEPPTTAGAVSAFSKDASSRKTG